MKGHQNRFDPNGVKHGAIVSVIHHDIDGINTYFEFVT